VTTVLVAGALANKPGNGGEAWVRLSWVLGLQRLGFAVYFVEQIGRAACVDATGAPAPFEGCANLDYFRQVSEQFGLSGRAALIYAGGEQTYGLGYAELLDLAEAADLLVNISGHLSLEALGRRVRRKAYIDIDPGFTQLWHAGGVAGLRLEEHDFHFTIGENIGTVACPIPTGNIRWRPTRQPVVLEHWPAGDAADPDRFTTVASWRGPYGPVQHGGKTLGLKLHEWRKFVALPSRVRQRCEAALDIHPADAKDLSLLVEQGWQIVSPQTVARDPAAFRRYVQGSGAEFSVAQGIYVETQSGWFSDRTARYLASSRPALVQDTGFGRNLPAGEGLVAFRTLEQAVAGAECIARDYERHRRAARALAEAYFDSNTVLGRLVEEIGVAP
jgi:hypothetical protein